MANPDDIKNKAAQVKANAGSDARKAKTIQIIGGLVVAAFVVGIIGVGFYAKNQSQADIVVPEAVTEYDTSAALPKGVSASEGYGVPVGKQDPTAPRTEIYEDFQCPACGQFEITNAKNVFAAAEKGEINLTLHPMIFLDRNFPESNLSSLRATMAWGCAVDAGKTIEYHSGIFAMQPAREGDGYSDEQLLDLAKKVGIENEAYTEFETCFTSNKYKGWAQNSELHAKDRGVQGTPSIFINDKALDAKGIYDPVGFAEAVAAAKK